MRSIRLRLFVALALAVLSALGILSLIQPGLERRTLLERNAQVLTREVALVARRLDDTPAMHRAGWLEAARLADQQTGLRITLIAADGHVFADSRADTTYLENHADRPEVRAALAGRPGTAVRRSGTLGIALQYAAVPARSGAPYAVVRVAEPLDFLGSLARVQRNGWLAALALALAAAFAVAILLARHQVERLIELRAVAERIGAGDPEARAIERPDD